jgi:glycosyltransferase involved in cell wall biosynthesis
MSGVRYVGYLAEGTGYGQAAREHLLALATTELAVGVRPILMGRGGVIEVRPDARQYPAVARLLDAAPAYDTVVAHTPPEIFAAVREEGCRNIGVAAWETEELPERWRGPVRAMDEIWVPSEFCVPAFRAATDKPVAVVRHPVSPPAPRPRTFPGVPDDVFLFVAIFEWSDRKNPEGLIRAFRRAFAGRRDVALFLKVGLRFGGDTSTLLPALKRLIAPFPWRSPPIYLLEQTDISRDVIAQLMARADAYASLHRAEGFGLCMAEAMVAGKPVVATGYSGNLEFMDASSAYLVDYDLVPLRQRLTFYPFFAPTMRWAEPRLDDAVDKLRACADRPSERARIAARGKSRATEMLAPRVIGARMRARVDATR